MICKQAGTASPGAQAETGSQILPAQIQIDGGRKEDWGHNDEEVLAHEVGQKIRVHLSEHDARVQNLELRS